MGSHIRVRMSCIWMIAITAILAFGYTNAQLRECGQSSSFLFINPTNYLNYENCTSFLGGVSVGLSCQDSELTNNMTFPNVLTIEKQLTIADWRQAGAPVACPLTSLTGWPQLTRVGGILRMYLTDAITVVDAFPLLEEIGGELTIHDMRSLVEIKQFPKLKKIGGLRLFWLASITTLNWMNQVTDISDGSIVLTDMNGLVDVSALDGVLKVHDLHIVDSGLSDLHGLEDLTTITGNLLLTGNEDLHSVRGLDRLTEIYGSLSISRNINLTSLTALNSLQKVGGTFLILNLPLLESFNNSFTSLYQVGNPASSIYGRWHIEQLPLLTSLQGFDNLISVTGSVVLSQLQSLTNIDALSRLIYINGTLQFFGLPSLVSLSAMNVVAISGSLYVDVCDSLTDVALRRLQGVNGSIILRDLPYLETTAGFESLIQVGAAVRLDNCARLTNVDVFSSLTYLSNFMPGVPALGVRNCHALTTLAGFKSLTAIDGLVEIFNNSKLIDLGALCSINRIDGNVVAAGPGLCCSAVSAIFSVANVSGGVSVFNCDNSCLQRNNISCACKPQSCQNLGTCVNVDQGFACSCRSGYFGMTCRQAYPAIIDISPVGGLTPQVGGRQLAIRATRLPLTVAPGNVWFKVNTTNGWTLFHDWSANASSYAPANLPRERIWTITFTTFNMTVARLMDYAPLQLTNIEDTAETVTRNGLLYVVDIPPECQVANRWWSGIRCEDCPEGGFCPGGDRVWPLRGYWSNTEKERPQKCFLEEACPGSMGEVSDYPSVERGDGTGRNTSQCATFDGYMGTLCSSCISPGWYQQSFTCRSCGLTADDRIELIAEVSAAAVFFFAIAAGVAVMRDRYLAFFVAGLVVLQQFTVVGTAASTHFPAGLARVFSLLSILNFDIQFVKAGCSIPKINFVNAFWYTMLIFFIAAIGFVIAAGIRAATMAQALVDKSGVNRMKLWKRRSIHALIIEGAIVYLQFCIRSLQAVNCTERLGQSVLFVEPSTVCYEGAHLVTAAFIWIFLIIYGVGFPLWCFYIVRRTALIKKDHQGMMDSKRSEKYGYLYRGVQERFYWFRILQFPTNFVLGLQGVLASNIGLRTFLASMLFLVNGVAVGVFWPFKGALTNLATILAGAANILQVIVYLAVYPDPDMPNRGAYFDATVTLFVISTVFIIVVRVIKRKETPLGIPDILRPSMSSSSVQRGGDIQLDSITSSKGRISAPLLTFDAANSSRRGSPTGLGGEQKRHSRGSSGRRDDEKRGSGVVTINVKDDSPRSLSGNSDQPPRRRTDSPKDGRPRKDSPRDANGNPIPKKDTPPGSKRDSPSGSKRDSPAGSKRDSPAGSKRDSPNQSAGSSRTTSSQGGGAGAPMIKRDSPNSSRTASEATSHGGNGGNDSPRGGPGARKSSRAPSLSGRDAEGDSRAGSRPSSRTQSSLSSQGGEGDSKLGRAVPLSRNPSLGEGDSRSGSRPMSRTISANSGEGDSRPNSRTTSARSMSGEPIPILPPPPTANDTSRVRAGSRAGQGGAGVPLSLSAIRPVSFDRTESGSSSRSSHSSKDGEGDSRGSGNGGSTGRMPMQRTESGGRSPTPPSNPAVSPATPTRTVSGGAAFALPPPNSATRPSRAPSDARATTSPRLAPAKSPRAFGAPAAAGGAGVNLADPSNLDLTIEEPKKPGDEF